MYKLNKTARFRAGVIMGTFLLGITGCNETTIEAIPVEIENEDFDNQLAPFDQDLNGCIVYKIITRTRTINPKTGGKTPWESEISSEFYIGTATEVYNEPIDISETEQIEKVVMGYINN